MPTSRLLPTVSQTQGRSCTTFHIPPLDGSLTYPQLLDYHGKHSADHRLFIYPEDDGTSKTITWSRASQAIRKSALLVRERLGWKANEGDHPVVAILSASDSIPYATTIMGIMRAGYTPFPLSTRNSPAAVVHLLEKTNVKHVIVGLDEAMQELVADAFEILKSQYNSTNIPETSPMPVFSDLYGAGPADISADDVLYEHPGLDERAFLLHSSGSTAFPKPIPWTHRSLLQIARTPFYGERDLTGRSMSMHGLPMFHAMGMILTSNAVTCGMVLAVPAPKTPPVTPTHDSVIQGAMATDAEIVVTVPSMIEAWSQNPEYVKWLATRDGVICGGGPLSKERGDQLVSQGVRVLVGYGSTECGSVNMFIAADPGVDWEYFHFGTYLQVKLGPYGNNEYEVTVVANEFLRPNVINTKVDGVDAYSTSDLVAPHPTKKGLYKVVGRTDDQIMHSTETMMNQDPHVQASVMFGRGKLQTGILVEPKREYSFDPSDEVNMNGFAPQHSRLFKEMILVAKPSKPFLYTAKHTVRRGAVIKEYEDEIDALYESVESSSQSAVSPPSSWDIPAATGFVRAVVSQVMSRSIPDDGDLFQHGCDSLQATYIRNILLRAVRETTKVDTRPVPESFVYDHPSITQLAAFTPPSRSAIPTEIERIYALNRPSRDQSRSREAEVGADDHGLDASVLDSDKVVLLEGDLTKADFGMGEKVYEELRRSVTHIIHNAWRVDFVINLTSFEPQVEGVRALVDFALSSPLPEPPRLVFESSMGTLQNAPSEELILESSSKPEYAIGTGYAESKWVSEQILFTATEKTALDPLVARLGQICAGRDGVWNAHEWFPSMVQSAPTLGCFPDDHKSDPLPAVDWIQLDLATAALVDFRKASSPTQLVHLVTPPRLWHILASPSPPSSPSRCAVRDVARQARAALRRQRGRVGVQSLRALHLLPMFRGMAENVGRDAGVGMADMDVSRAKEASGTMADPG
ncbi:uncharacterized protein B0H18DRAFT_1036256 [Fomitopsis serialis]|uniref:uncharacterized protein n=1 Tax=Fomitopsis serialis TaxID=139415 RepID=UPI0020079B4C|nr:uncharacterized protein B0H18DRAFT_1036256 [Neoantrodia serialis]KAH9917020.1 hypothetical protein B0H18DRAFT_1036256 [Neoantrodia serialis]